MGGGGGEGAGLCSRAATAALTAGSPNPASQSFPGKSAAIVKPLAGPRWIPHAAASPLAFGTVTFALEDEDVLQADDKSLFDGF